MSDFFDREGNPIDVSKWGRFFEDLDYKIVARDVLDDGKVVSTVWMGVDHNYFGDEGDSPIIFETTVFADEDGCTDLYMNRYSTEAEALEGHKHAVELAPTLEVVDYDQS